jgi:hypothetical protein
MTKAIIFDLDSCLAAADQVGEQLFAPTLETIRAANDRSIPEEKLRAAFAECWRVAFDGGRRPSFSFVRPLRKDLASPEQGSVRSTHREIVRDLLRLFPL